MNHRLALAALVALSLVGQARALVQTHYALTSAGGWMTNANMVCVTAIGQGSPTGWLRTQPEPAAYSTHAGFIQDFDGQALDTDLDGIPNFLDTDDDNDGILDTDEWGGNQFDPPIATDPLNPDSDGDGATDREEMIAGTNPMDANHLLAIESVEFVPPSYARVRFNAREGRFYDIHRNSDIVGVRNASAFDSIYYNGPGAGTWKTGMVEVLDFVPPTTSNAYYIIKAYR